MTEFLSYLINGLAIGCGFALVGSGLVAVHRVTGVVNFAQGMFAVVAGFSATSFIALGLGHGFSELLAVGVAALVGLLTGVIAIGKRGTAPLTSLIVTLGVGFLAYAVEVIVWGDQPRSLPGVSGTVSVLGARVQQHYLLIIAATLATFLLLWLFFSHTYIGKALSACASNPYAAKVMGINVTRMGLVAFALGGALGGIAGVLVTPIRPISFDSDVSLIVHGFAAAVLGGLTRPMVALAGGLLLGVTEAMVAGYASASYQLQVALGFMLAIMIWQAARRPTVHEEAA